MSLPPTSPLELHGVYGTCSDGATVSGISAAFSVGRLHIVRGSNGSGKSAIFRFAGLLEQPVAGEVLMDGHATSSLEEGPRTELRTQRLGFAFAAPFLLSAFNVIENVAMPLFKISHVDPEEARQRTETMLEFVGMPGAAEARIEDLTVSAQYSVALARGLVNEPAALLVEELDGVLVGAELDEFVQLLRKAAVTFGAAIIATSSPNLKTQTSDRVLDIDHGVIVRDSEWLPETCG